MLREGWCGLGATPALPHCSSRSTSPAAPPWCRGGGRHAVYSGQANSLLGQLAADPERQAPLAACIQRSAAGWQ